TQSRSSHPALRRLHLIDAISMSVLTRAQESERASITLGRPRRPVGRSKLPNRPIATPCWRRDPTMAATSSSSRTLEALRICGAQPFWSAADNADTHREQAYALLTFVAGAFHACDGVNDADPALPPPITSFRPKIIGHVLEGIAVLVALS